MLDMLLDGAPMKRTQKDVFDAVSSTANMIGRAITNKYFNEENEKNRI